VDPGGGRVRRDVEYLLECGQIRRVREIIRDVKGIALGQRRNHDFHHIVVEIVRIRPLGFIGPDDDHPIVLEGRGGLDLWNNNREKIVALCQFGQIARIRSSVIGKPTG